MATTRRASKRRGEYVSTSGLSTVVMFFLVPQVRIPKRLDVARAAERWSGRLPAPNTDRSDGPLATIGGAKVLGRNDIGHLARGMSADFIAFNIERKPFVGAHADPVAALILCQNHYVDYSYVNGRMVVDEGRLVSVDYDALAEKTRKAALMLSEK